jgi:hypothetical protein
MSRKTPRISLLELRKQLLIAESELNRAQLVEELQTAADGVRSLAEHAKSLSLIVSSTAMLAGVWVAFRRGKRAETGAKPSLFQTLLNSAGLIKKLWTEFRPRDRDRDET